MHERKYKPSANWLNGWQIGNCVVIVFLCLCEWNRKKEEERINAEIAAKPSGIPSIEWKIGKGKANPISTNRQRFKCENCVTTKCTKSHRHQKRSSVNKEVSNKMLKLLYLSYIYLFSVFLRANIHFLRWWLQTVGALSYNWICYSSDIWFCTYSVFISLAFSKHKSS